MQWQEHSPNLLEQTKKNNQAIREIRDYNLNSSHVDSLAQYTKYGSMEFLVEDMNLVWIIRERAELKF
jgi:hypothetical protein